MAYNYKENEEYKYGADGVLMNEEDYTSLQGYKDAWNAANAAGDQSAMSAAHDAAEALRAKYGYSGGRDGSEYIKTPETKQFTYESAPTTYQSQIGDAANQLLNREAFSYESAPEYVSKYQNQIDELTGQILNREAFHYDPTTDPSYAAYKKEYAREGQRAAADTMGQYAAMTGGMPSTAAVTASQQAGNYYAAQMADKIPELVQLAYNMYLNEGDQQRANLEMLQALESGDYAKYQALLSQYNTDRNFAYGVYSDDYNRNLSNLSALSALNDAELAQYNTDRNFAYGVNRDQVEDARYEDETAYNRSVYEDETAYNRSIYADETDYSRALLKAQTLAAVGDFSGYAALGYSDAEIANLKANYDAAKLLAGAPGSYSGGGVSGGAVSGADEDAKSGETGYDALFKAAMESGYPQSFITNNYKDYGFTSSSGLYNDYKTWAENGSGGNADESPSTGVSSTTEKYGAGWNTVWPRARTMFDQGKSEEAILDYLDARYEAGQLTKAGVEYIMSSLNLSGYRTGG